MELGCCLSVEQLPLASGISADFLELPASKLIAVRLTDRKSQDIDFGSLPPVRVLNKLLSHDQKVVGPNVDIEGLTKYMAAVVQLAANLGVHTLVFGSGRARSIPAGFSRLKASKQLAEFLQIAVDIALKQGVRIVIEPLRQDKSNFLNTPRSVLGYLKDYHLLRYSGIVVDLVHLYAESELESLSDPLVSQNIMHVHISGPERQPPTVSTGAEQVFLNQLQRLGYSYTMSIECEWSSFSVEVDRALRALRLWFKTHPTP